LALCFLPLPPSNKESLGQKKKKKKKIALPEQVVELKALDVPGGGPEAY
jgi:hypothetical protein